VISSLSALLKVEATFEKWQNSVLFLTFIRVSGIMLLGKEVSRMQDTPNSKNTAIDRRTFVKGGLTAAGIGFLAHSSSVEAQDEHDEGGRITRGDAALLRFAAAAEILETDFWVQYSELGGLPDSEVPGGTGNAAYTAALSVLDSDMAQYVHDNTDD
jgi:hypothetical protein